MENIAEILEGVKTMGIGGHIRPDGDCVGSWAPPLLLM